MVSVINHSTQALTDDDLAAISRYLKSLPAAGGTGAPSYADPKATHGPRWAGRRPIRARRCITLTACHCHGADGRGYAPLLAPLAGNPVMLEADASSLINVTLNGSLTLVIDGVPSAYPMPAFSNQLNDRQIADDADVHARRLEQRRAGRRQRTSRNSCKDGGRALSAAPCGTRRAGVPARRRVRACPGDVALFCNQPARGRSRQRVYRLQCRGVWMANVTYTDTQLLIDGEWVDAASGKTIDVVNPATGKPIGKVAHAGIADLDRALAAAQRGWPGAGARARARGDDAQAAALVRERADAIAQLMTQEQGKPLTEARVEVLSAADIIEWFADEGRAWPAGSCRRRRGT